MAKSYERGQGKKGKCWKSADTRRLPAGYGFDRLLRTAAPNAPCCGLEPVAIPAHGPDKEDGRAGYDHHPDTLQTRRVISAAEHEDGDAQRYGEE
jgi:hypothetical protein